ncbi:hypothetical protein LUD75_04335 [Epilithonimonas sp. JDS]|uniref:hypothetical protein n=1 Tax=Epilithonimonas sp. JDS TaxID=2902797 RepID=UPI001E63C3C6|nr:hypothetical protein [Epilithonimonas sp. JDS]MCD9853917.1 hypothetical protein [Epilithonimonas sp. JDS]
MKYLSVLLLLLMYSCSFNTTRQNRESDKKDAEKITQKFFTLMKQNNREQSYELFSSRFFKVTNKEKLNDMFDWTQKEGGAFSNYSLSHWETLVVNGTDSRSEYLLTYYVTREKMNTEEIFSMQKEGDSIKIVGYKINLDMTKKR